MLFRRILTWANDHPVRAGTVAGLFQQAASASVAICLIPILMRLLPAAESGLWFTFQSLVAIAGLADFGLGFAISRQAAHCLGADGGSRAKNDFIEFGHGVDGLRLLNVHAGFIYRLVGIAAILLGIFLFEVVVPHTNMLVGVSGNVRLVWYAMLTVPLCLLLANQPSALLIGVGKIYWAKILSGFFFLSQGVAVVVMVVWSKSLFAMALSSAFVAMLYLIATWRICYASISELSGSEKTTWSFNLTKKLLQVAAPMGIVNIGTYMVGSIQVPILGALLGPSQVAPFYLAQRISQFLNFAAMQTLQPQFPIFTRLLAAGDRQMAWLTMKKATLLCSGLVLASSLLFFFCSSQIAHYLAGGNGYPDQLTVGMMAIEMVVSACITIWGQFVLASGKNPFMWSTLISGMINIVALWLLIPRFGLTAIPFSTLIAGILTNYWLAILEGSRLRTSLLIRS